MKCSIYTVLIVLFCVTCLLFSNRLDLAASDENGVIENIQVAVLLAALAVFGVQAYLAEGTRRVVLSAGAVFALFGAFREIDIRTLNVPGWVESIGQGIGRDLVLAGLTLAFIALAVRSFVLLKGHRRAIASSCFGRTGIILILLLIISDIFEKKWFGLRRSQLYEELAELLAYLVILVSAITVRFLGIPPSVAVKESVEKGVSNRG